MMHYQINHFFDPRARRLQELWWLLMPVNKVNMRSECIQQIDKWYDMKQKGAISEAQYEELQAMILSDIKNL